MKPTKFPAEEKNEARKAKRKSQPLPSRVSKKVYWLVLHDKMNVCNS